MSDQKEVPAWVLDLRKDWETELHKPPPGSSDRTSPATRQARSLSHGDRKLSGSNGYTARSAGGHLSQSTGLVQEKTKRRSIMSRLMGKQPQSRSRSHSHHRPSIDGCGAAGMSRSQNPLDLRSISAPGPTSQPE
jgi:hypothetical protein